VSSSSRLGKSEKNYSCFILSILCIDDDESIMINQQMYNVCIWTVILMFIRNNLMCLHPDDDPAGIETCSGLHYFNVI
jgi:hypothetical protein